MKEIKKIHYIVGATVLTYGMFVAGTFVGRYQEVANNEKEFLLQVTGPAQRSVLEKQAQRTQAIALAVEFGTIPIPAVVITGTVALMEKRKKSFDFGIAVG